MERGVSAATPVAVQLVLAVDVSGSVSQDRFELQREGYAAAFRNGAVLQAIRSTSTGSIAVAMFQWTGPTLHVVTVDWSLIDDAASAERFAAAIQAAPRVLFSGGTSIGGGIDYAVGMLARALTRGSGRSSTFRGMARTTVADRPRMRAMRRWTRVSRLTACRS